MNWIFSTKHVGIQALPLGEIGAGQLVRARPRCSLSKEAVVFKGLSNSCDANSGLYIEIDQPHDEGTP